MKIRPALFIGLGSTGVNIIKEFRRFMYDQFSRAGLPIFSYIGIETDEDYDVSDPLLPNTFSLEPYENIHLIPARVLGALDVHKIIGPEVNKWLDMTLIQRDAFAVKKGAGSIRMSGRLALWMNWATIQTALKQHHASVRQPKSTDETSAIMMAHDTDPVEILPGWDIYLLGTLCGGTCGGMFIDLAYQIQRLLAFDAHGMPGHSIYGIFTILDTDLAGVAAHRRKAANCWASLYELDYYMDSNAKYDYNLPGALEAAPSANAPFSFVQLVSRTNFRGERFSSIGLDQYNGHDLNRMVGLGIFHNTFSGLANRIGAGMVDLVGMAASGNEPRNNNLRTKTLISFGVSALWNPRFQFAQGFACSKGIELCDKWRGNYDQARSHTLRELARTDWTVLRDTALALMERIPGKQQIRETINQELEDAKRQLNSISLTDLPGFLTNFPERNPLRKRFEEGQDLWQIMSDQVGNVRRALTEGLKGLIETRMAQIDPSAPTTNPATNTLAEFRQWLTELCSAISQSVDGCPHAFPTWEYKTTGFPKDIQGLSRSAWLWLIGASSKGIEKAKEKILSDFREEIEDFMMMARRHLVRHAFQELLQYEIPPYEQKIEEALSDLALTATELKKNYQLVELSSAEEFDNIIKVSRFPSLENYVESRGELFDRSPDRDEAIQDILRQGRRVNNQVALQWADLFGQKPERVAEFVRSALSRWALERQDDASPIIRLTLGQFGESNKVRDLALRSFPFVLMRQPYEEPHIPAPLEFICGMEGIEDLRQHLVERDPSLAYATHSSHLSNVVVLYRQMAPYYADNLHVAEALQQRYREFRRDSANLHTHKDQDKEFDKEYLEERVRIEGVLGAIQALYPHEVFEARRDPAGVPYWVFTYTSPSGKTNDIVVSDPGGQEKLIDFLAQNTETGRAARAHFHLLVRTHLEKNGKEDVQQKLRQLERQGIDDVRAGRITERERMERKRRIEKLFDQTFPPVIAENPGKTADDLSWTRLDNGEDR